MKSAEFSERSFRSSVGTIQLQIPEYHDHKYGDTHEPKLGSDLARTLTADTVFYDVGSCYGYFIEFALQADVEPAKIHAFEMGYPYYRHLLSEYGNSGVKISNSRVFAPVDNVNPEKKKRLSKSMIENSITIDDYVESHDPPDIVKIDVEGAEVDVLKGMKNTIEKYNPRVYTELHCGEKLMDYNYDPLDAYRYLSERGYRIDITNHREDTADWVSINDKTEMETTGTYLLRGLPEGRESTGND